MDTSASSPPKKKRLLHARHNEEVCVFLQTKNDYKDWVITTAFYTSLHYVNALIFPITISKRKFDTIDAYHNAYGVRDDSKHKTNINLVRQEIPTVSAIYKLLHDMSYNARYKDYNVDPQEAAQSVQWMNTIKNACEPAVDFEE